MGSLPINKSTHLSPQGMSFMELLCSRLSCPQAQEGGSFYCSHFIGGKIDLGSVLPCISLAFESQLLVAVQAEFIQTLELSNHCGKGQCRVWVTGGTSLLSASPLLFCRAELETKALWGFRGPLDPRYVTPISGSGCMQLGLGIAFGKQRLKAGRDLLKATQPRGGEAEVDMPRSSPSFTSALPILSRGSGSGGERKLVSLGFAGRW